MQQPLEVYANPYDELPLKSDKYASTCTDIHLGGRNITKLTGFDKFISLDTLWLNDNKLKSFEGLEDNFRLKGLHLFGNRLKGLKRHCLQPFKFLATLTLNDNQLDDIDNVLRELKCLKNLKTLNLYSNPIAEEDNYRLRVLVAMPSVTTFDRHAVSAEELEEVQKFKEKMKKLKNLDLAGSKKKKAYDPFKDEEAERQKALALKNVLTVLRNASLDHRLFLERSFLEEDKRHLGYVSESKFWSVLHEFGLAQLLTDAERDTLAQRYFKKHAKVEAISMTGTLPRPVFNYLKFCRDMLPDRLLVIPDHERWKREWAPEVSETTRALEKYVTTVKTQRTLEEALFKKRTMLAASGGEEHLINIFGGRKAAAVECGLSPWEQNELSKLVAEAEAEAASGVGTAAPPDTTLLSRPQCERVLKQMAKFKKSPDAGVPGALHAVFKGRAEPDGSIDAAVFRALIGCPPRPSAASNGANAKGGALAKSGKPPTAAAAAVPGRSSGAPAVAPAVAWRALGPSELDALESRAFDESAQLLDALLRAKPGSADYAALFSQAMQAGILGTRLGAGKARRPEPVGFATPLEVTTRAGPRADVTVLPNLLASVKLSKGDAAPRPFTTPNAVTSPLKGGDRPLSQTMRLMHAGIPPGVGWPPGTTTLVIGGRGRK